MTDTGMLEPLGACERERAAIASICVTGTLMVIKMAAFFTTESAGVLSSLLDSMLDAFAATVILIGVRQAKRPPSKSYRFGRGKAEPLAALAQAAFILGTAVLLSVEVANRLMTPPELHAERWGIGALVLSSIIVAGLMVYQRGVVRRTGSIAIQSDFQHYGGDLFINMAALAGLGLTAWTGRTVFDTVFALLVALFLLYTSRKVARQSLKLLMDREIAQEERDAMMAHIRRHPKARGVHDFRTRDSGSLRFVELHLELDGGLTLTQAHDITDEIERSFRDTFPNTEILIHQEPAGLDDQRLDQRIAEASKA